MNRFGTRLMGAAATPPPPPKARSNENLDKIDMSLGFGKNSLSRRGRVMPGKRRPYGIITGLAARKATGIRKGISPMNRPPLSDKNIERYFPALKRKANLLRQNEVQRKPVAVLKRPNQLNRKTQKPRLTRTAVPSFLTKREQSDVKKVPKGVPLQFDINSVGKQTGMTLNERFGILKEQRATLTFNKGGSRFVTVG
uniref:UAP56-interacting factor n=2 Tax=Sus scrofa TaxID=9823 RepID=A0A4X1TM09_PIG